VTPPQGGSGGDLRLEALTLHTYLTLDVGHLVTNRGSETVVERGRVAWLSDVLEGLRGAANSGSFGGVRRVGSAYARTDRFGRSTLNQDPGNGGLPVQVDFAAPEARLAGALAWRAHDLELGPSGALSLHIEAELAEGSLREVSDVVRAYHGIRREAEGLFEEVLKEFVEIWNSNTTLSRMFQLSVPARGIPPCLVFDVLDFDYTVDGRRIPPKELYASHHVGALRALAGLTRMSSVYDSFDEASVRNLADLDLGSRSDELWLVNEARLVRSHPERGTNPYVDAFFEDVCVGIRMQVERASSLIFLMSWLKQSQSDIMHRLAVADSTGETISVMRELLSVLTEMGYLVSDPAHLEDTSGHSFFRNVMTRASDRLALETRRQQIHGGFMDLLSLSQALSGQSVANGADTLQRESLAIARSSRRWAVLAVIFALVAVLITSAQFVLQLRSENGIEVPQIKTNQHE
jgi:hypothetical protein